MHLDKSEKKPRWFQGMTSYFFQTGVLECQVGGGRLGPCYRGRVNCKRGVSGDMLESVVTRTRLGKIRMSVIGRQSMFDVLFLQWYPVLCIGKCGEFIGGSWLGCKMAPTDVIESSTHAHMPH